MASARLDPAILVRDELRQLKEYHLDLSPCRHKLDQNEVPWELPGRIKRRIAARWLATAWADYPDFHADDLRVALGRHNDWPAAGILVGNGSNELLGVALEALARPGGEVLATLPSFSLYRMFVLRAAATPRFVGPAADLRLPLAELAAEIERDPRRPVILCSPNNPTGDAAEPARIAALLERLEAPLLLDNAYAEFCRHDYRPLLDLYPHLVIFRTFSKAWSLGGQRLGYLLADPRLVSELIKVKLPYNVGRASALAGEVALAAKDAVERRVRVILGRRRQWVEMLSEQGLEVFPSQANFLLVRDRRAAATLAGLEGRGIRVRDVSGYPGLSDCWRISVGHGRALRDTRAALVEILAATSEDPS